MSEQEARAPAPGAEPSFTEELAQVWQDIQGTWEEDLQFSRKEINAWINRLVNISYRASKAQPAAPAPLTALEAKLVAALTPFLQVPERERDLVLCEAVTIDGQPYQEFRPVMSIPCCWWKALRAALAEAAARKGSRA